MYLQSKKREEQERERLESIRTQKSFEEECVQRTQQQQQQQRKPSSSSSAVSATLREAPEVEADREREERERAHRADVERRRRQDEVQSLVRRRKESFEVAPAGEENRAEQMRRQRQEVATSTASPSSPVRPPCAL